MVRGPIRIPLTFAHPEKDMIPPGSLLANLVNEIKNLEMFSCYRQESKLCSKKFLEDPKKIEKILIQKKTDCLGGVIF